MSYIYQKDAQDWLHFIRHQEIFLVLESLPDPPLKILEIGGGDGYIASIFSENGYAVTSIDIDPRFPQCFPVQKVLGSKLPFQDKTFDIIFSSNVLEHVADLELLLHETKRVTKKNAVMIHTMPTPAWRFYTLLELPLKLIISSKNKPCDIESKQSENSESQRNKNKSNIFFRALKYFLRPHGKFPSAFHELVTFSPLYWRKTFSRNGFRVFNILPLPIIYGCFLFPWKFMRVRKKLVNWFTTPCLAYYIAPFHNKKESSNELQ